MCRAGIPLKTLREATLAIRVDLKNSADFFLINFNPFCWLRHGTAIKDIDIFKSLINVEFIELTGWYSYIISQLGIQIGEILSQPGNIRVLPNLIKKKVIKKKIVE